MCNVSNSSLTVSTQISVYLGCPSLGLAVHIYAQPRVLLFTVQVYITCASHRQNYYEPREIKCNCDTDVCAVKL